MSPSSSSEDDYLYAEGRHEHYTNLQTQLSTSVRVCVGDIFSLVDFILRSLKRVLVGRDCAVFVQADRQSSPNLNRFLSISWAPVLYPVGVIFAPPLGIIPPVPTWDNCYDIAVVFNF